MEIIFFTILCVAFLLYAKTEPRDNGEAVKLWMYTSRKIALVLGVLCGVLAIFFYQKSIM